LRALVYLEGLEAVAVIFAQGPERKLGKGGGGFMGIRRGLFVVAKRRGEDSEVGKNLRGP
jgi:hypothetical protein